VVNPYLREIKKFTKKISPGIETGRKPDKGNWLRNAEDAAFYHSRAWKKTRDYIIVKEPWCRECRKDNVHTPAYAVDHKVPISEGGSKLDLENLQPLCKSHHARKTGQESNK